MEKLGLDSLIGLSYSKKYIQLHILNDEELKESFDENTIKNIKNAKCGYIRITKISDNPGYLKNRGSEEGWTGNFGVGLSCILNLGSSWYHTSIVKDINWKTGTFQTENSTYKFHLEEHSPKELLDYLDSNKIELNQYDSKCN